MNENNMLTLNEQAWALEAPNAEERLGLAKAALDRKETKLPTIFKNSENSARTTAEHIILTGTDYLATVANFSSVRLAKYASIAIINCNIQIEKEFDLRPVYDELRPFVLDYCTSSTFKKMTDLVIEESKDITRNIFTNVIEGKITSEEEKDLHFYSSHITHTLEYKNFDL